MNIKNKPYILLILIYLLFIILLIFSLVFLKITFDTFVLSATTLSTVGTAFLAFYIQRSFNKRDIAKLILQEIRHAEKILSQYSEKHGFSWDRKIIINNSWRSNMHYFIGDLENDEIEKINNIYFLGAQIDKTTSAEFAMKLDPINVKISDQSKEDDFSGECKAISYAITSHLKDLMQTYQPIYYTPICEKLKKIAKENK